MKSTKSTILTINTGSSSIKFALYKVPELKPLFFGEIENLEMENTQLKYTNAETQQSRSFNVAGSDRTTLIHFLIDWLKMQEGVSTVKAIGYRIVHGMQHRQPEKITAELLQDLKKMSAYDLEHLPAELLLINLFRKHFSEMDHIACFDTDFHSTMPKVAALLAIPRRYFKKGIQRYGFHGLSCAYIMEELTRQEGPETAQGKVIIAHLGSGASITAVKAGKSMDTSMGFTPGSGLPMATRSGDFDPGVCYYLMKEEKTGPEKFNHLINHQSGLLGISETSSDMRELLKLSETDPRACEAIEFFCYQAKKCIGSFAAALGGIDTLIFSGGIGEHIPEVRQRICHDLQFLGIELENTKNRINASDISTAKVKVKVIQTNEELMIAKIVERVLQA